MRNLQRNSPYHIYNRGNRKMKICIDYEDYSYMRNLIFSSFPRQSFDLLAYCIMPNHFHILVVRVKNPTISHSMQLLGASYTRYFNKKYKLVGHLFQGTYKYRTVRTINQLLSTAEYISKNPLNLSKRKYPWVWVNRRSVKAYALLLFK